MSRLARLVMKGAFALGILATLGFGATQAAAKPTRAAAPQCEPKSCDQYCRSVGAVFGYCGPYFTGCICEY